MNKLIVTTIIWSLSFSLIGEFLAGKIDSYSILLIRVLLASLVFIPFIKLNIPKNLIVRLITIGAVQIGLMSAFYYQSFLYLNASEIALFTIFTPIYITIFYDFLKKEFHPKYIISVSLAIGGAYVIKIGTINPNFLQGFLLIQAANICFALGQVSYKILMEKQKINHSDCFAYFYFGAFIVALTLWIFFGKGLNIQYNNTQILVLLWLGIVASALGYYLWNKGACEVDSGILSIMNNMVVPLAILIYFIFFNRPVNWVNFLIGSFLMILSLWVHQKILKSTGSL